MNVGDPDGYGRFGLVDQVGHELQCHECPATVVHLGLHAFRAHGISADDYRARHGLARRTGLVARETRERIQENARHRMSRAAGRAFVEARDPQRATVARLAQSPRWRPASRAAVAEAARRRGPSMRTGRVVVCETCAARFCPLSSAARRRFCSKSCASRHRSSRAESRPVAPASTASPQLDPTHLGRVPATQAARIAGIARSTFHWKASAGTLPAVQDARGRWWARPTDMEVIRRARAARAAKVPNRPGAG